MASRLGGLLVCQYNGWLVCWLVDLLYMVVQSTCWLVSQPVGLLVG